MRLDFGLLLKCTAIRVFTGTVTGISGSVLVPRVAVIGIFCGFALTGAVLGFVEPFAQRGVPIDVVAVFGFRRICLGIRIHTVCIAFRLECRQQVGMRPHCVTRLDALLGGDALPQLGRLAHALGA